MGGGTDGEQRKTLRAEEDRKHDREIEQGRDSEGRVREKAKGNNRTESRQPL